MTPPTSAPAAAIVLVMHAAPPSDFPGPDLDQAVTPRGVEGIVVTPRLTPAAIDRDRSRHPGIRFPYAWPAPPEQTAAFLADHIHRSREEDLARPAAYLALV